MSEAIFGLIGVVVGGVLNATGLYFIERRRDRREARTAARMLVPELQEAARMISIQSLAGRHPHYEIETARWREWESALAARLPGRLWADIAEIYLGLGQVNDGVTLAEGHLVPLSDRDRQWLEKLHQGIMDCLTDLYTVSGHLPDRRLARRF